MDISTWISSLVNPKQRRRKATGRKLSSSPETVEQRILPAQILQPVKHIVPGNGSPSIEGLTNVGGALYFTNSDGSGRELWRSNGTSGGTGLVRDIRSGAQSSLPEALTGVNGTVIFRADDGVHGWELWKTDGTSDGTQLVRDISVGDFPSSPLAFVVYNNRLYFRAIGGDGSELWSTDGTEAGTMQIKDIRTGGASSSPDYPAVSGGILYFNAIDDTHGYELWRSDGTEPGTRLVRDIFPGSIGSDPHELTDLGGTLYFTATDETHSTELWKSNGQEAGTELVKDIRPGSPASDPTQLTVVGDVLYFTADDGTNGRELWKSNGTAAGTQLVKNIRPGSGSSMPQNLTNVNGVLFFTANDGTNGTELWRSDGTPDGTQMVSNIAAGSGDSWPVKLTSFQGMVYFSAVDGSHGRELWRSNGTSNGTTLVVDAIPGAADGNPDFLTVFGDKLYLTANSDTYGRELFVLAEDVTPAVPVVTAPGSVTTAQRPLISWGAVNGAVSYEVWVKNQSTGVNPFHRATVNGNSYTPDVDFGIGKFNLWVCAVSQTGLKSAWTAQYNFSINTPVTVQALARYQSTARPTLSWNSLPGAARYDLWMNNLTTGVTQVVRDSQITATSWTPGSDMPMGRYRAWVRGIDAAGGPALWSSALDFSVLPAPAPVAPLQSVFSRKPQFSWAPVAGAVGYDVVVRNRLTNAIVYNPKNIVGTSWTPPADLADVPWRWWVNSVSADGYRSQAAPVNDFFVGGRTELLNPIGITNDTTPTFSWRSVTNAASYRVYVNRLDVPVTAIIDVTVGSVTSYTPANPLPVGTYRVWIRAVSNTAELGTWSNPIDFSIASAHEDAPVDLAGLKLDLAAEAVFAMNRFPEKIAEVEVRVSVASVSPMTDESRLKQIDLPSLPSDIRSSALQDNEQTICGVGKDLPFFWLDFEFANVG